MIRKISRSTIGGLVSLLLGIAVYLASRGFPALDDGYPGPGLFPSIIGGFLALAGLVLLFSKFETSSGESVNKNASQPLALVAAVATLVAAYFGVGLIGLLPTIASVILVVGLLARANVKWIIAASLIATALIYFLFSVILGVPL